jgi:hypothetical protein
MVGCGPRARLPCDRPELGPHEMIMGPRGRPVGRRKPVKPPHCRPMFIPQLSHVGGGVGPGRLARLVVVGRVPEGSRRQDGRKSATGRSTTAASHRIRTAFAHCSPRTPAVTVSSRSAGSLAAASRSGNTSGQLLYFCCTFAHVHPLFAPTGAWLPSATAGADKSKRHNRRSHRWPVYADDNPMITNDVQRS